MSVSLDIPLLPQHNNGDNTQNILNGDSESIDANKNKCLEIWLKLCSYSMGIYCVSMMFLFISGVVYADVLLLRKRGDWYAYVVESSWVITTYSIFVILHYNLTYNKINKSMDIYSNEHDFNNIEYYVYSLIFLSARIALRIFPIIKNFPMKKSQRMETANNISTLILNTITMYSVCLIILSFSLVCVEKYNKLIIMIKNGNINIDQIKDEVYKIQNFISRIKLKWQIVASIVFCHHLLFASLNILSWFLGNSVGFAYYHGTKPYVQLTVIVIRTSMWMFGILYGIVKMNACPAHLARVINKHCSWTDEAQQAKIQRLTTELLQFPECFKVMFVTVTWKHFTVIIVSALTSLIGALIKKRLS